MSTEKFEAWAIVELFGHQRTAGRLSEQAIGGETFLRVDVPRAEGFYTRMFGKGAIYCINVCEETVARSFAMRIPEPLQPYVALPAPSPEAEDPEQIAGRYESEAASNRRGASDDFDDDQPY